MPSTATVPSTNTAVNPATNNNAEPATRKRWVLSANCRAMASAAMSESSTPTTAARYDR